MEAANVLTFLQFGNAVKHRYSCPLDKGRRGIDYDLRSAQLCQLTVPRTKTCYGDRSFSGSGPAVWNSLPAALRCDDVTLLTFRARLKSALFNT